MCTFHVGGAPDRETSGSRWEFFIGDRPHCASVSINGMAAQRQPIEQIGAIEHFLDPGEVAVSTEVAEQASRLSHPPAEAKLWKSNLREVWQEPTWLLRKHSPGHSIQRSPAQA